MTPLHYYYWLLASGGTLLDGYSIVSLGIAIPLLKQELAITPVLVGLIGSALVLGAVLGGARDGIAADRPQARIRRGLAILVIGSALCAAARDPASIIVGQFLIRVGIGIDFPTSGSYVAEIMPRCLRFYSRQSFVHRRVASQRPARRWERPWALSLFPTPTSQGRSRCRKKCYKWSPMGKTGRKP